MAAAHEHFNNCAIIFEQDIGYFSYVGRRKQTHRAEIQDIGYFSYVDRRKQTHRAEICTWGDRWRQIVRLKISDQGVLDLFILFA